MTKIRTIVIDTFSSIYNNDFASFDGRVSWDIKTKWMKDMILCINKIKERYGFEGILILGAPGCGKTNGMFHLPKNTNIYFNCDAKDISYAEGIKEYGRWRNPNKNHQIVKSYKDITNKLDEIFNKKKEDNYSNLEIERYAIFTGHTERAKGDNDDIFERFQMPSSLGETHKVEGKFNNVFKACISMEKGVRKYKLQTVDNKYGHLKSSRGMFEQYIENDYNFVINKLLGKI